MDNNKYNIPNQQKLEKLYSFFPVVAISLIFSAFFLGFLALSHATLKKSIAWLAIIAVLTIINLFIANQFNIANSKSSYQKTPKSSSLLFIANLLIIGLAWGIASYINYIELGKVSQSALILTTISICLIALFTFSLNVKNYIIFSMLSSSPLITHNLLGETKWDIALGIILLFSLIILFAHAFYSRKYLLQSLHYQRKAELLTENLTTINARLSLANESLKHVSATDEITGVSNRKNFDERLVEAWAEHARENENLSMLLININNIKKFDDQFEHDKFMRKITRNIYSGLFRPRDFLARYDSIRFSVLLPMTPKQGAEKVAQRIHDSIKKTPIKNKMGVNSNITLNIGIVSTQPKRTSSVDNFLEKARESLLQAEQNGEGCSYFLEI